MTQSFSRWCAQADYSESSNLGGTVQIIIESIRIRATATIANISSPWPVVDCGATISPEGGLDDPAEQTGKV